MGFHCAASHSGPPRNGSYAYVGVRTRCKMESRILSLVSPPLEVFSIVFCCQTSRWGGSCHVNNSMKFQNKAQWMATLRSTLMFTSTRNRERRKDKSIDSTLTLHLTTNKNQLQKTYKSEFLLASSPLTKGQQGLLGPSTASRWELIAGVNRERVNAKDQKQKAKRKKKKERKGRGKGEVYGGGLRK